MYDTFYRRGAISSSDVISTTVAALLQEYFKTPEHTVFWDDALKINVDPFPSMTEGFFAADWDLKVRLSRFSPLPCGAPSPPPPPQLKILRQMVELQLCYSLEIKAVIDRAWGVIHNKHKKIEASALPPPPGDPQSQERLQLIPLGQDKDRKRYWVIDGEFGGVRTIFGICRCLQPMRPRVVSDCRHFADAVIELRLKPLLTGRLISADSPRVYMSTNPWKITATFQTIASTREEFITILERVKVGAPSEPKAGERKSKLETAHLALLKALQDRVEIIDNELAVSFRLFIEISDIWCHAPRSDASFLPQSMFLLAICRDPRD